MRSAWAQRVWKMRKLRMDTDPRPYARWWWFSNAIDVMDIDRQVAWAAANGFGGLEIAFVYHLPERPAGARFLSPEWTALCVRAREACAKTGIGCDLTFGTMWPFGGHFVAEEDGTQCWNGASRQRMDRSWEKAHIKEDGPVLNHLSRAAFARYAERMAAALLPALHPALPSDSADSLFCDSWEVETDGLWTSGFGQAFKARFGYEIEPWMEKLDTNPEIRYDYRLLIAEYALEEFYKPFADTCHALGSAARVQCHGAPTNLIAAYAEMDIPESEAVLFDPEFGSIAASAALLSGKRTVSSESFTCLYGWIRYPGPAPHEGGERLDDLKLTADAIFAGGVNHIVWHGMPFQAAGERTRFYASVHVGPDSVFAPRLREFNGYLERISSAMKRGRSFAQVACFYPFEDSLMAGELPPGSLRPSGRFYWEMHELRRPAEALPYGAVWIDATFLARARPSSQASAGFSVGDVDFAALYLDTAFMERVSLERVVELAEAGVRVVLKRVPAEPGTRRSADYKPLLARLRTAPSCRSELGAFTDLAPVVSLAPVQTQSPVDRDGTRQQKANPEIPPFWIRRDGNEFLVFLAHPAANRIGYPVAYGFAQGASPVDFELEVSLSGTMVRKRLSFGRAGALLLRIKDSTIEEVDLGFDPWFEPGIEPGK